MQQPPDPTIPTHAFRNNPGLRGLGLSADIRPPSSSSIPPQQPLTSAKMPSVAPLRPQRRPTQEAMRRVGSLDDSLTVPARSDSLKNRKSRRIRTASLDSPLLGLSKDGRSASNNSEFAFAPRDLDRFPHGHTPQLPFTFDKSIDDRIPDSRPPPAFNLRREEQRSSNLLARPQLDRSNTSYHTAQNSFSDYGDQPSPSKSSHSNSTSTSQEAPNRSSPLRMQFDGHSHSRSRDSGASLELSNLNIQRKPLPNQGISPVQEWSRQTQSDKGAPSHLPILESIRASRNLSPTSPINLYTGNPSSTLHGGNSASKLRSGAQPLLGSQKEESEWHVLVEELREELRAVSVELAASIQREMDLEDEVDRLKTEMPISRDEPNRRTSDYYSDSTGSSIRFPLGESETKIEGLEKMRRKAEQEKAQMRHSMAQKLQEDVVRRRTLELHCQTLEERLSSRQSLESHTESINEKAKELEASLSDARRKLNEERQIKQSVEDLLNSLREDAETQRNERDNLRDEVVPQLRARLEGLETEAAETQKLAYENSRMQQEIESLRTENKTLVNARKLQMDLGNARTNQGMDELSWPRSPPIGVSRSGSLAGNRGTRPKRFSISSGHEISETSGAEMTVDSLKDVEDQRDALHKTLKDLIYRQNHMSQQHAKQIRALETERDKALNSSPRRKSFNVEVQQMRNELENLRRRADDAIEQKWQCEKGLSGLKMDLDRAQHETVALRTLLHEHEDSSPAASKVATSDNLDKAYEELRQAHAESLLSLLAQPDGQSEVSKGTENRIGLLFSEIEAQRTSDADLQRRLAAATERGLQEQQASAQKIEEIQAALKAAEDKVMDAQGASEQTVSQQEEFVRDLKEMKRQMNAHGLVRNDFTSPRRASTAPLPNTFHHLSRTEKSPRVPQMEWTPALTRRATAMTGPGKSEVLEQRVRDLEEEAGRAGREIRGVVERMNAARVEVAELQVERDEAAKQTRKLQKDILEERQRLKVIAAA